jgi:hypothetical protein
VHSSPSGLAAQLMPPTRPLRSRQDVQAYRPCATCGQPVLHGATLDGQVVPLDVGGVCYVVLWLHETPIPALTRCTAVHFQEVAMAPPAEPPLAGCMECKAQRPYTVKTWPNGNTTWHWVVCGTVVRLVPGQYSTDARSA